MDVSHGFWNGKRVFITGHTGFKGAWLALWLQNLGADVTGYALPPPTDPSLFRLARVGDGMRLLQGDVRDLARLGAALAAHRPEVVVHMAAQPLVLPGYEDPVTTFSTNVLGTVNVLEGVRRCDSIRALVIVTSDKCYHNLDHHWSFRETDRLGGLDPYSSSKGCAEIATAAFRHSYFAGTASAAARRAAAVATVRAGNVVGGGDWSPYRLVPDMMRALLAGHAITIRRPDAVRPWQHVLEPLRGYLGVAERLWRDGDACAEAWNFGPRAEDAWPVGRVVEKLVRLWGENADCIHDTQPRPAEAGLLRLDCSKARSRLGWEPVLSLDDALPWIVEWFKAYRARADMRALTLAQIERYEARARGVLRGAAASANGT